MRPAEVSIDQAKVAVVSVLGCKVSRQQGASEEGDRNQTQHGDIRKVNVKLDTEEPWLSQHRGEHMAHSRGWPPRANRAGMPAYDFTAPRLCVKDDLARRRPYHWKSRSRTYLATVLRLRPGERVLVFNGRDGEFSARLAGEGKRRRIVGRAADPAADRRSRPCAGCSRRSSMPGSTTWSRRRWRWASARSSR